VSVVIISSDN